MSGKGDLSVSPPVYNPLGPHPQPGVLQLAVDSSEMLADKSQRPIAAKEEKKKKLIGATPAARVQTKELWP